MRCLVLGADYRHVLLRDGQAGQVEPGELGLPAQLIDDINDWNEKYQVIIPRDMSERSSNSVASLMQSLDRLGLKLAERVAEAVSGGAKVRYYSEGLLTYLP